MTRDTVALDTPARFAMSRMFMENTITNDDLTMLMESSCRRDRSPTARLRRRAIRAD